LTDVVAASYAATPVSAPQGGAATGILAAQGAAATDTLEGKASFAATAQEEYD